MSGLDHVDLPVPIGGVVGGRYVVTGVLGQGGMGLVLAGRHQQLGERVAIKFLHREHSGHADRFFREARAAARIRSEHVVRIFDVGRLPSGEPYIVMEHLKGEDLSERLERTGPLAVEEAAGFVLDVCKALAEAHGAGVVHRDLKPANIFLAKSPGGDELVKLLDFGIAKVPEAGALTRTTAVLGSPVYMSPEQLMASREVDARSDIWSLGVVLFELLTAALPFEGASLVELGILMREKPTPSARVLRPELPEGIDAVIGKCLAKDRTQRHADIAELAEALEPFVPRGVAHTIPKIRRVLADARPAGSLASTMPPPSDEPSSSEVSIPASTRLPTKATVASRPALPASGSLVAVFTGAGVVEQAATRPRARLTRRRLIALASGLGVVAVVSVGLVLRALGPAVAAPQQGLVSVVSTDAPAHDTAPVISTHPSAPVTTSVIAPLGPEPPAPPANSTETATEPPTTAVARPTRRPSTRPSPPITPPPTTAASPPATAVRPEVNCNPPYTIDEHGVRRAKRECL